MPDKNTELQEEEQARPPGEQSPFWKIWTTEPKLLAGIGGLGALLVGIAAIAGLFDKPVAQPPAATSAPVITTSTPPSEATNGVVPTSEQSSRPPGEPANGSRRVRVQLERATGVDLDAGRKSAVFPSSGADVGIGRSGTFDFQGNGTYLYPMTGRPSLEACSRAISAADNKVKWIGLQDVSPGAIFCVTTDEDRTAAVTAVQVSDRTYRSASIMLDAVVWD